MKYEEIQKYGDDGILNQSFRWKLKKDYVKCILLCSDKKIDSIASYRFF